MKLVGLLLLALLASATTAQRTLVLLDDLADVQQHSRFFEQLRAHGQELEFRAAEDEELQFSKYGEFTWDSLVLFCPQAQVANISPEEVLRFIDEGGNVLAALDTGYGYLMEEVAAGCGVLLDEPANRLIDHLNHHESDADGEHTVVVASNYVNGAIIGGKLPHPVMYEGVAFELASDNSLVVPVLRGSPSSFSLDPAGAAEAGAVKMAGENGVLVAALQARNNARVVLAGSVALFSDNFAVDAAHYGNAQFVDELASWALGNRGRLRLRDPRHHRMNEEEQHGIYTIREHFVVECVIEEFDGQEWVPYVADDVQIELQMLDPYVRTHLKHQGDGNYAVDFTLPDVYGVFTLKLNYHRLGYSALHYQDIFTIRPLRHDQYERFIPAAYPYYASAFSMMVGVVLFSFIFLFHKDQQ